LYNLLRFDQSISPGNFRYVVENRVLYWPLRIVEHSADLIDA